MIAIDHSTPAARRRLAVRALAGFAAVAFLVGLIMGATTVSGTERTARSFAAAWERGDYPAMYSLLTPAARERVTPESFKNAYVTAAATATAIGVQALKVHGDGRIESEVRTRIFGTLRGDVRLPVVDDRIDWKPHLVFPGLSEGVPLTRRTTVPLRAKILSREGRTIVSGPATAREVVPTSPAASIAGSLAVPTDQASQMAAYARGFPLGSPVGTSGLERALEPQVAGRPGGELLAGGRRLAASRPVAARPVRSSIDLQVQAAAVGALAGRFGGIAALEPGTGRVRALAGIAFSAPQPPGSTFKIITATAGLEERLVKPKTPFPVETHAVIDGVDLENANGEACGGTFVETFAHSCNSVFAPLGVKLGAQRLVAAAEKFGFNETPSIVGAAMSTLPPAEEIDSPLAVGSTAIGQGKVLATPLEMAVVADTIASGGVRHRPTLLERGPRAAGVRVTTRRVARLVERMMIDVVRYGTGTAASLAPVPVAGKTGTAELQSTQGEPPPGEESAPAESDTDAWFAAYAPTRRPRLSVGVLFVKAGAGGTTAAPAARIVLAAGLKR
ncbi:MAG: penicillin-binding protein [Solirubrobacteraceae bacterium]|nr:penicillin-binding protein [Solirubrobacteraceae bacterium]